jgi:hypothetical protein
MMLNTDNVPTRNKEPCVFANICMNILQAALPQSITSFIFAKEYGLHADVLSTSFMI